MSCFVHSDKEFSALAKYLREVIGLDAIYTEYLIFNLYQFELIAANERFQLNEPVTLKIYEGEEYENLEDIEWLDALRILDSVTYQASDMSSKVLRQEVHDFYKKMRRIILSFADFKQDEVSE